MANTDRTTTYQEPAVRIELTTASLCGSALRWGPIGQRPAWSTDNAAARAGARAESRRQSVPKVFPALRALRATWNVSAVIAIEARPPHPLKEQLASALSNPLALRAGVR